MCPAAKDSPVLLPSASVPLRMLLWSGWSRSKEAPIQAFLWDAANQRCGCSIRIYLNAQRRNINYSLWHELLSVFDFLDL